MAWSEVRPAQYKSLHRGARRIKSAKLRYRLIVTVDVAMEPQFAWPVSLIGMRRLVLLGISAAVALFLAGSVFVIQRSKVASLRPAELASKRINPPQSWSDPDCQKLRRTVRTALGQLGPKSAIGVGPLSAEEIAVYRAVLLQLNSDARPLNLAERTLPLDVTSSDCECLKNFDVQNLIGASHPFHRLTRDAFPERNIRVVDAAKQFDMVQTNDPHNGMAAGKSVEKAVNDAFTSDLFSVSEIAFDKEHQQALVSYSFVCGSLCGSGGTWLLERVDGVWKRTKRTCGGWVS